MHSFFNIGGFMKNKVEILAPAGSYQVFKAVINAGADAVYLAGNMFGARAYAGNFSDEELINAIEYSKIHGKKLYLTVNTLLKNKELYSDLYNYILPLYEAGLDGVIVQDYGVMKFIHECFPDIEIHASTQMTITEPEYADFLNKYGVTRLVPARELSLDEIRRLHTETGLELETFVHGALCYCYSGMCFMSSFIGGRSGNRGRCAGTCRLEFSKQGNTSHLLSLKDLCTLDILPDILEAGVFSLKIEGRMKSAEYAAGVTAIYRKYVDMYLTKGRKGYSVDSKDIEKLLMLFDRGGMTNGYYVRHNGKEMIADEFKSDKSQIDKKNYENYIHNKYVEKEKKPKVNAIVTIIKDNPVTMTLSDDNYYITVSGDMVSKAISKAITYEDVEKQLRKFGQTMFELGELDIILDEGVFLPLKTLNELRRNAVEAFKNELLSDLRRNNANNSLLEINSVSNSFKGISVRAMSFEQIQMALNYNISRLIIDTEIISMEDLIKSINLCHKKDILCYIGFPRISRYEKDFFTRNLDVILAAKPDGFMIRNIAQRTILNNRNYDGQVIADFTCYGFNNLAISCIEDYDIHGLTYSVELNERELSELNAANSEMLIYGRIPLMYTANCIDKTTEKCHTPNGRFLTINDRKNAKLPVYTCCRYCYNIIYNVVPLYLIDKWDSISKMNISYAGIAFSNESSSEVKNILEECENAIVLNKKALTPDNNFTRGHFTRGVD